MNELFNRAAIVTVRPKAGGGSAPLLSARNGIKFSGFRVAFEIGKNTDSAPDASKIHIYNLKDASRAELEVDGLEVKLDAGYSGIGDGDPVLGQIFVGNIRRAVTERRGPDIVTTIEAADGAAAIQDTTIDQTFSEGTSYDKAIRAVVDKLGKPVGQIVPGITGFFKSGFSVSGLASEALDSLTAAAGLDWHITDGEVYVLDPTKPTNEPALLISPETGLIGVPNKGKKDASVVEFEALINPGLKPGRLVQLESKSLAKPLSLRVVQVHFHGDTEGGDWLAKVEAS